MLFSEINSPQGGAALERAARCQPYADNHPQPEIPFSVHAQLLTSTVGGDSRRRTLQVIVFGDWSRVLQFQSEISGGSVAKGETLFQSKKGKRIIGDTNRY